MVTSLQEKFKKKFERTVMVEPTEERVITHQLSGDLAKIAHFSSLKDFQNSSLYQGLGPQIEAVTRSYEYGCYADPEWQDNQAPHRSYFRAVLWNLDHGVHFKGILEALRNRGLVGLADIYFFPQTDIGRACSHNQNIVRNLAIELGYNYFFATSFLNLPSLETTEKNQDWLGLTGNAIMTRFPLSNLRVLPLDHADSWRGPRRLGCEKALLADVTTRQGKITLVCLHIPACSSPRDRVRHLKKILDHLKEQSSDIPVILAGDLKTCTYNLRSRARFFLSLINKLLRGFDYIVAEHHPHPEKYFDRSLFEWVEKYGFSFEDFNEMGKGNWHVSLADLLMSISSRKQSESWLSRLVQKKGKMLTLKSDWFMANRLVCVSPAPQAERPKVITHLYHEGESASAHDPVLLDFELVASR